MNKPLFLSLCAAHGLPEPVPECELCHQSAPQGKRFCSIQCRNSANARKQKRTLRKCAVCGNIFRTSACYLKRGERHGKCCSRKCAAAFRSLLKPAMPRPHREPKPERKTNGPCKNCGGFVFSKCPAVFCSRECVAQYKHGPNNQNWKAERPMAICVACNKEYKVEYGSRGLVCSSKCWGAIKSQHVKGHTHPTGKGGKRADLGNVYFRSRWEANWARYLNWLIAINEIASWEYEPDTFEFKGVRRGTRFYTPDFKVTNKDGEVEYHEVKGWMTDESKTKLKRMSKYYPDVKIVVVDKAYYRSVAKQISALIPEWEICKSHGR